jgi:hypothetical protein
VAPIRATATATPVALGTAPAEPATADTIPEGLPDFRDDPPPLPDLKDTPRADPHPDAGVVRTLVDPPAIVAAVAAADVADGTDALPDLKDTPPPVPALDEVVPAELGRVLPDEPPVVAPGLIALPPSPTGRSRRKRPAAGQPVPLGALSSRQLDKRATAINIRRLRKLEPGFGSLHRLRSLLVLVVIVALIAAAFAAALDIVVSIISVFANHAISKSAGS